MNSLSRQGLEEDGKPDLDVDVGSTSDLAALHSYDRTPLKLSGKALALMSFSTLGIIYSDIGTSPLYVLSTIWPSSGPVPSEEDVVGCLSAIVWAMTLLPLIKYIGFALCFGTGQGEGGPFALFLEMFPCRDDNEEDDRQLTRYPTNDIKNLPHGKYEMGRLARYRWPLLIWTLFGAALTLADGILTPSVSVTSAVGGLTVVAPFISNNVPAISIAFLVALFLAQPFGTGKLSFAFAPLTFIWLSLIGTSGMINIAKYPGIFRAYDPSRAIMYFVRTRNYDTLAGVLLCVTGCEAMFANLGQFSATSIRISFVGFVYPALILQYLGQGAMFITNGETIIANPFYLSIPGGSNGGLWWATWIMGVVACLIASQAMITATFSIIHQLMGMKCFPRMKVLYTSTQTVGQVYIPAVSFLLMIGTIATVGAFGSSFALTLAYGFAVATVMIVTTSLIAFQIPYVKQLPWLLGVTFFIFFGFLDGLFWGASLRKVPEGAWFPLSLGCIICIIMIFWTWGREKEDTFDRNNKRNLARVIFNKPLTRTSAPTDDVKVRMFPRPSSSSSTAVRSAFDSVSALNLDDEIAASTMLGRAGPWESEPIELLTSGGAEGEGDLYVAGANSSLTGEMIKLERTETMAIFYKTTDGKGTPHAFSVFLRQVPALPRVVIFLTIRVVAVPTVPKHDRYVLSKVRSLEGFYGITMRKGYMEHILPDVDDIVTRISTLEAQFIGVGYASKEKLEYKLQHIRTASKTTTHIVPSYTIVSHRMSNIVLSWFRKFLIEDLYGRMRVIFPDETNSPKTTEETLAVSIVAVI